MSRYYIIHDYDNPPVFTDSLEVVMWFLITFEYSVIDTQENKLGYYKLEDDINAPTEGTLVWQSLNEAKTS